MPVTTLHDGTELAAQDLSGEIAIYSLRAKPSRIVPGSNGVLPLQWSADGRFLLATVPDELPARTLRVDTATGRQELVRKLMPTDLGGIYNVWDFHITPDGQTYTYTYRQTLSTLYVADGLR